MQIEEDFYNVLGVPIDADAEQIRHAYRKLAFEFHPDRNHMNSASTDRMEMINKAYAIISDPVKRKEYDMPRGYRTKTSKFQQGSGVKVNSNSTSPYRDRTGVIDKEPVKDAFRFWYMVKFESKGFTTVVRLPEEELSTSDD
jgi:DnaJ-class molecular chaperone